MQSLKICKTILSTGYKHGYIYVTKIIKTMDEKITLRVIITSEVENTVGRMRQSNMAKY